MKVFGRATIKHPETGKTYDITGDMLDFQQVGGYERAMGVEKHYVATLYHPELEESEGLEWNVWEYPIGMENFQEPEAPYELVEDNFNFDFLGEIQNHIKECIEKIHPKIFDFDQLILLDVNIKDYSDNIITEDYMLLHVDEKIRNVLNNLRNAFNFDLDAGEEFTSKSKYIFAKKHEAGFDFSGRVVGYLNNRFGNSLFFSDVGLVEIDIISMNIAPMDWINLSFEKGDTLDITLEGFRECLTISKYTEKPSRNDIDVNFIFEELEKLDETHLFRGVSNFYGKNDGIASSIYRNNKKKIIEGKLQEYEKGIVDKFLGYPRIRTNIAALTELRHSGRDTSLIDFTKNSMIALFFACQRESDTRKMGEVIYFDSKELGKKKKDVKYLTYKDFVVCPLPGPISEKRVGRQKSVFVYAHQGYLPRDKYQAKFRHLLIDFSLKNLLLKKCGYTDSVIYPDVLGFCENPRNFEIPINLLTPSAKAVNYFKNVLSGAYFNYKFFCCLDVNIKDYKFAIINEDYILLKIDKEFLDMLKSFSHRISKFETLIRKSEYVLAVNGFNRKTEKVSKSDFKKSISLILNFAYDDEKILQERTVAIDTTLEEIDSIIEKDLSKSQR